MGRSNAPSAYAMNFLRSVLLIPPIGLISAAECSIQVRWREHRINTGRTIIFGQVTSKTIDCVSFVDECQIWRWTFRRRWHFRGLEGLHFALWPMGGVAQTCMLEPFATLPEDSNRLKLEPVKQIMYVTWMFCSARFSAAEPPWERNCGRAPVTNENKFRTAVTIESMFKSVW